MSAAACRDCASRGVLLAVLAGHIDRSVDGRIGERAKDLLALSDEDLARSVDPHGGAAALRRSRDPETYERLLAALAANGCWSTCVHRPDFPASLEALGSSRPRALFCSGERSALAAAQLDRSVTVVGSRRAGAYGREIAHELSRLLAASGVHVISGMALGVDSAAHEGALRAGGSTVAVLGAGPDRPYPRSRSQLFTRIRAQGAVISELPPCSPTFRWVFPARNRLMAASLALIIGGALGNALDRILLGGVADFFSAHAFGFYWYIFNLADVAIVAGVAGLLYDSYKSSRNGAVKSG